MASPTEIYPSEAELLAKIKQIVALNKDYFQSKIKISQSQKPYVGRLKLPHKTPKTTYKEEYEKARSQQHSNTVKFSPIQQKASPPNLIDNLTLRNKGESLLELQSSYQKDYKIRTGAPKIILSQSKPYPFSSKRKNKINEMRAACEKFIKRDTPRYLNTQNNMDFLNWGGHNNSNLILPSNHNASASTDLPFTSNSVYNCQFTSKAGKYEKREANYAVDTFPRTCDFSVYKKSYYGCEYSCPKPLKTINYRVEEQRVQLVPYESKQNSEYQNEFRNGKKSSTFQWKDRTVSQLQQIVIRA